MRVYYLSVQQGAAPSLFAATVTLSSSSSSSSSSLLPYVSPYRVYFNCLAFEMMGPFGGADWATPSQPPRAEERAQELYKFSEDLINKLVKDESDEKFANQKFQLM
jgi:hypothetical protein